MGISNIEVVKALHKQYPKIGSEIVKSLSRAPVMDNLSVIPSITPHIHSSISGHPQKERITLFVCIALLLFDPNVILHNCPIKTNYKKKGLREYLANEFNVTGANITYHAKKARILYRNYSDFSELADRVVKVIKREYGKV